MKFNILYVDPPWEYENKNTGGNIRKRNNPSMKKHNSGSQSHYLTMNLDNLKKIPIHKIIEKDSIIFLWCTVPLLDYGFELLKSWKFKYKTIIVWRKIVPSGLGYWFRGQIEVLMLGIKGKVKPFRCQKPNFIQTRALKHSEKPEKFRHLIDEAISNSIKNPKKIELFARKKDTEDYVYLDGYKSDWTFIGNEIDGKDIIESIEELSNKK